MIKSMFSGAAIASSIALSSSYALADPIVFNDIDRTQYYEQGAISDFISDGGFTPLLENDLATNRLIDAAKSLYDYDMHGTVYINENTGEWLLLTKTYKVQNERVHDGYIATEEPVFKIPYYGSYYNPSLDNHGQSRKLDSLFNHEYCKNIETSMAFHTSTNMIFTGMDESSDENRIVMLFTGTGAGAGGVAHDKGYIAVQHSNDLCYIPYMLDGFERSTATHVASLN